MIVTLLSMIVTAVAYIFSRRVATVWKSPLTTPVFLSSLIIIGVFLLTGISYEQYGPAKELLTYLLGPATVALAVPIYKNRELIRKLAIPVSIGIVAGSTATIAVSIIFGRILHLSHELITALGVKSATVPIAVEVIGIIDGDVSLTAAFVMLTGVIGAMVGPWFLNVVKITDPVSRGLAIGTISHGIGTAEIAREGELQGAAAGIAMALAAVFTSIAVPMWF
ncbi:Putative effector of murein hydrolase [Evansella caseinilytica]|uniref:Putative effector of murein hydrolase n=1 Tax=Evansella caseinilytica TaxID=1503961 RepID=A0A1H3U0L0_9BACI|nr:LrgB family protein [Evansella caseinilytica]SDZ55888.1 Putative effector of murein hydrolase [Evansella caseinilytica]